jgi:NAD(P)-dependent dehydrogenase (short-subunit alcohol dehydrogenase family)
LLRLSTAAHLDIARHFGERLVRRGSGGLMFVGAMGADKGIPFMANEAGAKAYVRRLSLSVHEELKSHGIHVTVLPPASAGLIVAEATAISPDGFGYADTPGLWSAEQVRRWRLVTDAVHAAGGRIIAQLWHTGAIAPAE